VRPLADAGEARGEDLVPSFAQQAADSPESVLAASGAMHQYKRRRSAHARILPPGQPPPDDDFPAVQI